MVVAVLVYGVMVQNVKAGDCCSSQVCKNNLCGSDPSCSATCVGASVFCGTGNPPIIDGTCVRSYTNPYEVCDSGWSGWSVCGTNFCQSRTCSNLPQLQIRSCGGGTCGSATPTGGSSCPVECRANACGNGYEDAAGCGPIDAGHPNFGCRSNQAYCRPNSCDNCQDVAPGTPTLSSPPDGTSTLGTSVYLQWNPIGSWGVACTAPSIRL